MAETQIRFDDGAAYERAMGNWSRRAGSIFLDWLAAPPGLKWIDVGCGNGAFTELIVERCAPAEVQGIDPSEDQLAFARKRPAARVAKFSRGDAMSLPFPTNTFDAATMALVITFVPDPIEGVVEMARPPSLEASRIEVLRDLWTRTGLDAVETCEITVQRTFDDFEDFWKTSLLASSARPTVAAMVPNDVELLKARVRARLPADATGRITYSARANAVKGRVTK
jgi:SAM-dependent methyltransferase